MNLIGQSIAADNNTTGTTVYTPWVRRQGDCVTIVAELIARTATAFTLDIVQEGKNQDEADSSAAATGASIQFTEATTVPGVDTARATGVPELVRFKCVLKRDSGSGTIYAHFRILGMSWEVTGA